MKNYLKILLVLFITSCAKDTYTPLQKFKEDEMLKAIDAITNPALSQSYGKEINWDSILILVQQIDYVKTVESTGMGIAVTSASGRKYAYQRTPLDIKPPYFQKLAQTNKNGLYKKTAIGKRGGDICGNYKALLINQQYNDYCRTEYKILIESIKIALEIEGYEVDVVNGQEASYEFMKTRLDDYGFVFFMNHGGSSIKGDEWVIGQNFGDLNNLPKEMLEDVASGNLVPVTVTECNSIFFPVLYKYFSISKGFFNKYYDANSFDNAIWYVIACQGMKKGDIAQSLIDRGAKAIIGWDEINCLGQSTGELLMSYLLSGYSVEESFNLLPFDAKNDNCEKKNAKLVYKPTSGGDCRIVETDSTTQAFISTTSPTTGTSSFRVINLAGSVNAMNKVTHSIVETNGVSSYLPLDADFKFKQQVVLESGANEIIVRAIGLDLLGKTVSASKTIKINGNFPQLDLWSELIWNQNLSDMDIHLLRPGCENDPGKWIGDSTQDCFWDNKTTSWGASLDVDNVIGYGPEHITIPATKEPGIYTLIVSYYLNKGQINNVDTFLKVRTKTDKFNSKNLQFEPHEFGGWYYIVCQIELPSGKITNVMGRTDISFKELVKKKE